MPQILTLEKHYQAVLTDGIPSGVSESSDELSRTYRRLVRDRRNLALLYPLAIPENLSLALNRITRLFTWPEGWNGYNALSPQRDAIVYARNWIRWFYQEVSILNQDWLNPHVTASAEGEVVFEWRQGVKRLTIYVGNQGAEYVKSWGPDINTQMEDGHANTASIRRSLWMWLMSK